MKGRAPRTTKAKTKVDAAVWHIGELGLSPIFKAVYQRGVIAAAAVADGYSSTSSHPYRLGDCVMAKLNVGKQKPRINRNATRAERDSWMTGFAVALAEMHRRLAGGNDSMGVCVVARGAGLTLKAARAAGVSSFDLKELKRAGIS